MRCRVVTCVTTYNRINYFSRFFESWKKTKSDKYDHKLIVADDGSKDGTRKMLKELEPQGVIAIYNNRLGVAGQTNSLFSAASSFGFDYGFKSDDDIFFKKSGWDDLYINAIKSSKYDHLCYYNEYWRGQRRNHVSKGLVTAKSCVLDCLGCFWTFTPEVLKRVGSFDAKNFGFMGHEHIDFSMRCCRAGMNNRFDFFDASNSSDFIGMYLKKDGYVPSLKGAEQKVVRLSQEEIKRRWNIIFNENRIKL